jgi:4-amino-4-deoxy-L-arabinose transferase-like glycosyltransferase
MQLELSSIADPTTHFVLRRRLLLLICLFLAAMGLRIYHIDEPPLEFHATRQYRSLLIAREYYYESSSSVAESRKRIAQINYQRQGILEPPVMELLTSIGYRFFGEKYWIPRTLSAIFWLIGGGILYRISKKIADDHAALFSTAFYLFIPFAVTASRSFQPDPLMVMLLLASIYGILRYDEQPMRRRLFVAAIFSAIAILIKPVALFVIYSTFLTLFVIRRGVRRAIADKVLIIFMLGSLLPSLLFYFYGLFFASSLQVQAQSSFLPHSFGEAGFTMFKS